MRRFLALVVILGGACDRAPDASTALAATAATMGEIRSGDMKFELVAETDSGARAGFVLEGLFAFGEAGELPTLDMQYTPIAGDSVEPVGILSTGEVAYVEVEGIPYELPLEMLESLRAGSTASETGLEGIALDRWIKNPLLEERDGLHVITGRVDVGVLAQDWLELASSLGAPGIPELGEDGAEQLDRAVDSATIEVISDPEDHLLREVGVIVELGANVPAELAAAAGELDRARVSLRLEIDRPNEAIQVDPPAVARPFDDLLAA